MSWWLSLGYNFDCNWLIHTTTIECDWLIELSDNNLASELVENRSVFQPITIQGIVIFMMIIIRTIIIVIIN